MLGLVVSSVLVTLLLAMNYTKSLIDQFTFIILLATLTTLVPYAYSAAAQLMLLVTDRARFPGRRLAGDALVALLAFGYRCGRSLGPATRSSSRGSGCCWPASPSMCGCAGGGRAPTEAEPLTVEELLPPPLTSSRSHR